MPDIDKKGIFGYFGGGLRDKVTLVRASGDLDADLTHRGNRRKFKVPGRARDSAGRSHVGEHLRKERELQHGKREKGNGPPGLFSLKEKAAIVTGGGSGLGRAIAKGLADAGAWVAVADISKDSAQSVAKEIRARKGQAIALKLDVTQLTQVEAMAQEVQEKRGQVDILVNSAGITFRSPALEYPEGEWDRVLNVNLKGTFLCCQAVGKAMVAQGKGSIINIASIGGLVGYGGCIAYLASKGGVVQLTRGLAVEWAKAGVRVNAIAPFVFDTPLVSQIKVREPDHFQRMIDKAPMGRLGHAEELIGTAIFLASAASELITGHILAVDGGFLAQ